MSQFSYARRGGVRSGWGYARSRVRVLVFRWLMSSQADTTRRNKAGDVVTRTEREIVRAAARDAAAAAQKLVSEVSPSSLKGPHCAGKVSVSSSWEVIGDHHAKRSGRRVRVSVVNRGC